MKGLFKVSAVIIVLAAVTAAAVAASRQAGAQPAAGAGAVPAGKVAVVDTEEFTNQRTGVAKIVAAFNTIESEFKPRRDDLQNIRTRYEALVREISAPAAGADQRALAAKAEQATNLKTEIDRKQQDGQRDYERRWNELSAPIFTDLNTSLREYARQRDVALVVDIAKLSGAVLVVNDALDITKPFIADYNRRNPAPGAAARP